MPEPVQCARGNRGSPVSASPNKGKGRRHGAKTALFRDNTTVGQRDTRTSLVVWNQNFVPVVVDSKQQSPLKRSPRTSPILSHVQGSPRSSPNHHEISAITSSPVDKPPATPSSSAAHRKRAMSQSPPTPVYAGAKFSEAPPAGVLPPPPIRWTDWSTTTASPPVQVLLPTTPPRAAIPYVPPTPCSLDLQSCHEITNTLKGLLKVQC